MHAFRKTFFTLFLLLLTAIVSGGELDRFSKELDFIEYSFLYAASQPHSSENRRDVEKRLNAFYMDLMSFYRKIKHIPKIPNFMGPAANLPRIFRDLGDSLVGASSLPRIRGTALGNYNRTYNEYLRDINKLSGKKGNSRTTVPTLKTLPLANYKAWLDRVTQDYIRSFSKIRKATRYNKSGNSSSRKNNHERNYLSTQTRSKLEEYAVSIAQLRLCFAIIAQNKLYKE